jgi:hypothetical protein
MQGMRVKIAEINSLIIVKRRRKRQAYQGVPGSRRRRLARFSNLEDQQGNHGGNGWDNFVYNDTSNLVGFARGASTIPLR